MYMMLMKTKYPKNVMNKTSDTTGTQIISQLITVQYKTPLDGERPTVLLKMSDVKFIEPSHLTDCNYCILSGANDTERIVDGYYYISDIVGVSHDVVALNLELDILETFRTEIQQQYAVVARSSSTYNTDIVDPNFITTGGTETSYIMADQQNVPDVVVSMRTL